VTRALLFGLLAFGAARGMAQDTPHWRPARPDYVWSFPRDHQAHPAYRTEWWYFTGIVTDSGNPGRRFGYQFTFFRVGLTPDSLPYRSLWSTPALIMGHASVSDFTTGRHVFSEVLFRPNGLLGGFGVPGDSVVAWSRAPYGTDARWTLVWNGKGFDFSMRDAAQGIAFAFATTPSRPLVLEGPNGFSRKGNGATSASLYYSFTRLATAGTLEVDGERVTVSGESWMDQEFGSNQLDADQSGWDWFSLRLDDGRDVMVYRLRGARGEDVVRGTVVGPDGRTHYVEGPSWAPVVTRRWHSDTTGADYPAVWRLGGPGRSLDVEIVPLLPNQENVSALVPGLFYWEGAVEVRRPDGTRIGEGYVELTGYGTKSRPAI
jgi:predicted secreted hydrolase